MTVFGKTDIGRRDNNEDCYGIYEIGENAILAVVCDGMGGQNCGELASRMALDAFADTVLSICRLHLKENRLSLEYREAELIFSNAISHANDAVYEHQSTHEECAGMGTTLVAALVCDGNTIAWVNIGDSRLYTVDSRDILQVTKDHSYLQYLIDTGLPRAEAEAKAGKNLITRAIGIDRSAECDIDLFELSPNETRDTTLLLCSDGLSGFVPEDACMTLINDHRKTLEEKADALLALAEEHGSSDNVTLILISLT